MDDTLYPGSTWSRAEPEAVGVDDRKLERTRTKIAERADGDPYRIAIVRKGRIVAEWVDGIDRQERTKIASVRKAIYSTILGIAIEEGVIPSVDAPLGESFPEAFEVLPGEGPKEDRHARRKDRDITFRQLISNTSGYLKPQEPPGEVFHYQTFGMNVLIHAIAKRYGLYDVSAPEESPGFGVLIDSRIRVPLQGSWEYVLTNFDLPHTARLPIFGYSTDLKTDHLDMARLGWLWCQGGQWKDQQIVPAWWMEEATTTAAPIRDHEPRKNWKYGYGFWTNDHQQLWPSLPSDSFAASGVGKQHIWMCPKLDLVVAQSPGVYMEQEDLNDTLLPTIVNAVRG